MLSQFRLGGDTEASVDRADLSKPLSRPELISLVDFKIEARPREIRVDRSYASIGFVAHRGQSFADRQFLCRGFELPNKTYTYERDHGTQWGVKGAVGFSQGSPLGTVGLSYDRSSSTTTQAIDDRVMPKCLVKWEEGEEWGDEEDADESYSSYNISFQPREVCFSSTRDSEPHPLAVNVGMGVNFRSAPSGQPPLPPLSFVNRNQVLMWILDPSSKAQIRGILVLISSYLDDVHKTENLEIFEQKEVEFDVSPPTSKVSSDQSKPGTISLSVAQVNRPDESRLVRAAASPAKKFNALLPKFLRPSEKPSPVLPEIVSPHEYLARGWDVNNNKWRKVLWPALDKDFRVAALEQSAPCVEIEDSGRS
ncbi:hypothetical protein FB45DRAFT_898380 [Roridomyces roridus]|uniref:Uncharacterized protein n=1 Tax=Roridomyces roridus TaxID=1738132 RepID=A0AAD7FXL6_9AGAR|nr:hypothetical protein FB45DRAFT_898380 [Roridomyces roridus]